MSTVGPEGDNESGLIDWNIDRNLPSAYDKLDPRIAATLGDEPIAQWEIELLETVQGDEQVEAFLAVKNGTGYTIPMNSSGVRYIPPNGLQPGDVILTRSSHKWGWWIRLSSAFRNKPNLVNHVIVVHHEDKAGVLWGIEGRPGGVGWVKITDEILLNPYTMDNREQVKSDEQRRIIVDGSLELIDTEYSWRVIAGAGADAVGFPNPWDRLWEQGVPSQFVCSSMADWLYFRAQLASPPNDENCTPGDWAQFIIENGWA